MVVVLLIAGIGLLVAGLLTVGYGILLDLSFGNTLILAGAIVACTGAVMLGLWMVVRELKNIGRRLGPDTALDTRAGNKRPAAELSPEDAGFPTDRGQPSAQHPDDGESGSPPPWHEQAASRDRVHDDAAPEPAEAAAKPKRNLLFSSSSRKERDRAQARTQPPAPDLRPAPVAASAAITPAAELAEAPPATFDDAWPKPERARPIDGAPARRLGRAPPVSPEPGPAAPPLPRGEEPPQITVLKSGVVDGMAYSLYSDGSIEAQMPEGMMRFASIDELRAHLEHRP